MGKSPVREIETRLPESEEPETRLPEVEEILEFLPDLTDREFQVFFMIGQGMSNAEIAAELYRSPLTIRTHVKRCHAKLYLRGRGRMAVAASRVMNLYG